MRSDTVRTRRAAVIGNTMSMVNIDPYRARTGTLVRRGEKRRIEAAEGGL